MKTEKKILDNGKYHTSEDKLPFMAHGNFPISLISYKQFFIPGYFE